MGFEGAQNETRKVISSSGSRRQTLRMKAKQNAQSNGSPNLENCETKSLYSLFPLYALFSLYSLCELLICHDLLK